jgi:hypothetical protein
MLGINRTPGAITGNIKVRRLFFGPMPLVSLRYGDVSSLPTGHVTWLPPDSRSGIDRLERSAPKIHEKLIWTKDALPSSGAPAPRNREIEVFASRPNKSGKRAVRKWRVGLGSLHWAPSQPFVFASHFVHVRE